MALQQGRLARLLQDLSDESPQGFAEAGRRWSALYASYAADARSVLGGAPIGLSVAESLLTRTLAGVFATSSDPVTTAQNMAAALTAFWLLPPVAFSGATPGAVTAVGGTVFLAAALASAWGSNLASRAPAPQAAASVAAALHAFTETVIVTHPTPTPTVGPIT